MVADRHATLIGQDEVRDQLDDLIDAAMVRRDMPGDILITGAGGLGKTSFAGYVARRLGVPFQVTMSTSVRTLPNMIKALRTVEAGSVWFLDEVHKVMPTTLLLLYSAIEDREFSVPGEMDPVKLPSFTFIAATTDPSRFEDSFRERFDLVANVTPYADDELSEIIIRGAESLLYRIDADAALDLARRSRGTPRTALRLMRRARDRAQNHGHREVITVVHVAEAMDRLGIDHLGLTALDRRVVRAVAIHSWAGVAIGIEPIVTMVGNADARKSIKYLQQIGLFVQTKPGQMATGAAFEYLDATAPGWRHAS